MKLASVLVGAALALIANVPSVGAKGLTVDDMLAMQRVAEPSVSPDGKWVAFSLRTTDMEANRGRVDLWLASVDGTTVKQLTTSPDNDTTPVWSPDGTYVYFASSRSGSNQVWRIKVAGGEAEQVTKVPLDVGAFSIFPDGKKLLLAIDIWPKAKTLADSVKLDAAEAAKKTSAQIYDSLLFRHWDQWEDGRYQHLFVWDPGKAAEAKDLTPGLETDAPIHPFGDMSDVDISPDGKTVAYVIRNAGKANAYSTNTDVFLVSADGKGKAAVLTTGKGYDQGPVFSPDGKSIAVRSMARAGYEADKERLLIIDVKTKKERVVTDAWDRSVSEITWAPDGKTIYTSTDNVGNHSLFAIDVASGKEKLLVDKGTNQNPLVAGTRLVFLHDTLKQPAEIFSTALDGTDLKQVTHINDARVKAITWGEYEQFSFKGAKGDTVYGYVMKPAGYKSGKVPVAFLVHGGPQGSFGDHFHYRWNAQAYAGRGYGAIFIDFHGSTGYGQAFTDAIRGDWGGAPYEDLMTGLDEALKKYTWLDASKLTALGASYGGYMINWIHGHTDRFKALVCHDGNLDERLAYYDTEELWFPEWEHQGTPWENSDSYTKHNPIDHVKNWKTPTMVIHGGKDFRVVDTQGMSTFTALQRKGIPSKFIHFPDENHWVLKPHNSKVWHDEVLAWLDKYTGRK